jgi:thymidine kinase
MSKSHFTKEQIKYIEYAKIKNTKLIATAGAGKSFSIINRMNFLIEQNMINSTDILMLTFSRFTRDDFINKIRNMEITNIDPNQIKTIDSFAKCLIDENNEIDVSLLSYRFMKYLESSTKKDIRHNDKLKNVKCIFVDEAQDLNETQYKILMYLKEKNKTKINLIGDPNQNIYQFRNSSDKFLTQFKAKTFHLTKNFRSYNPIVEFSKYLRPVKDLEVEGQLGQSDCLPNFIFHENDSDLEKYLVILINEAQQSGIQLHDIAILAPTRGRMMGFGRSHGLCLVSNLLYKNNIKFKQFYEETVDDNQTGIKYAPETNHVNILTYIGSKGLEWKFVILIDADVCLINKRHFTEEKHKNDQYLLYVACSRAVTNMVIFSKYKFYDGNVSFQLNPWFDLIPKECYVMDNRLEKLFKYPKVNPKIAISNEKRITKIIDGLSEEYLDELSIICDYGCARTIINNDNDNNSNSNDNGDGDNNNDICDNRKIIKNVNKIYDKDFSVTLNSSMFLGKYIKELFFIYYNLKHNLDKRRYIDIENIINKRIVTGVSFSVSEWFYKNRDTLSWEKYDEDKNLGNIDDNIIRAIDSKFERIHNLQDYTIVNDGYFKTFILSLRNKIEDNYEKYLSATDTHKIKKYLFNIMIILYSLDTQHYFHALSRGKKFKNILIICDNLFNNVKKFAFSTNLQIKNNHVLTNWMGLNGEIDLLTLDDEIWEVKCISDITLKHILQVLMYNIMYNNYDNATNIKLNFINFLKGEQIIFDLTLTLSDINRIKEIFQINS